MAAPDPLEVANMRAWNVYRHFFQNRQMYVAQGRAVAAGIKAILQKAQAQPANPVIAEDDIATGLHVFLMTDPKWTAYLQKKAHMTTTLRSAVTDTFARFAAWEAYVDITK